MHRLPKEILTIILLMVPTKGICRMVCREWRDILLTNLKTNIEEIYKSYSLFIFSRNLPKSFPLNNMDRLLKVVELGNLKIFNYISTYGGISRVDSVCEKAMEYGQLEILKSARKFGFPWSGDMVRVAINNKHFHVFKWVTENGIVKLPSIPMVLAKSKEYSMLLWAVKKEYPVPVYVHHTLLKNRRPDLVKSLFPFTNIADSDINAYIVVNGTLDLLKWSYKNGCPINQYIFQLAVYHGKIDMLNWLSTELPLTTELHRWAICSRRISSLKWLISKKIPLDDEMYSLAQASHDERMINLLNEAYPTFQSSQNHTWVLDQ